MNAESMNHVSAPPTVAQEKASRQANRDTLAAWFQAHPLTEISPDELERMVGRNYQQRISDCRTELGMALQNCPKYRYNGDDQVSEHVERRADGSADRLAGWYLHRPKGQEALGRDCGALTGHPGWPSEHPAPFQPVFCLTPPD